MSCEFHTELLNMPVSDLYRIFKTLCEMLADNGFQVEDKIKALMAEPNAFVKHMKHLKHVNIEQMVEIKLHQKPKAKSSRTPAKKALPKIEELSSEEEMSDEEEEEDDLSDEDEEEEESDALYDEEDDESEEEKVPSIQHDTGLKMYLQMSGYEYPLTFYAAKSEKLQDQLVVLFVRTAQGGVHTVKQLIEFLQAKPYGHVVLVTKGGFTSFAKKPLQELCSKHHIRQFRQQDLLVNISKHQLVDKHQPLTTEEVKALFEKFHIQNKEELPRMSEKEAIAVYYGFKAGDIVKVKSKGHQPMYRLVEKD